MLGSLSIPREQSQMLMATGARTRHSAAQLLQLNSCLGNSSRWLQGPQQQRLCTVWESCTLIPLLPGWVVMQPGWGKAGARKRSQATGNGSPGVLLSGWVPPALILLLLLL